MPTIKGSANLVKKSTKGNTKRKQSRKNYHAQLRRNWAKDGTYDKAFEDQKGRCSICGLQSSERKLDCDHNHRTGKFRGLLCRACNRKLRYWLTKEWMRRAIEYLERAGE